MSTERDSRIEIVCPYCPQRFGVPLDPEESVPGSLRTICPHCEGVIEVVFDNDPTKREGDEFVITTRIVGSGGDD